MSFSMKHYIISLFILCLICIVILAIEGFNALAILLIVYIGTISAIAICDYYVFTIRPILQKHYKVEESKYFYRFRVAFKGNSDFNIEYKTYYFKEKPSKRALANTIKKMSIDIGNNKYVLDDLIQKGVFINEADYNTPVDLYLERIKFTK